MSNSTSNTELGTSHLGLFCSPIIFEGSSTFGSLSPALRTKTNAKDYFSLSEAASCSGLFITQRVKGLKPTQVAVHCRGLRTLLGRCVVTANLKRSRFSQSRLEAATC